MFSYLSNGFFRDFHSGIFKRSETSYYLVPVLFAVLFTVMYKYINININLYIYIYMNVLQDIKLIQHSTTNRYV